MGASWGSGTECSAGTGTVFQTRTPNRRRWSLQSTITVGITGHEVVSGCRGAAASHHPV